MAREPNKPRFCLVSFTLCPYVQRSVITLEEKQVPYEIKYVDIYDKPHWLLDLSPLGKVPVLEVDGTVVFESTVINEYIEEAAPGQALHPSDPLDRAHNRAWIEVGGDLLRKTFKVMHGADQDATRKAVTQTRGVLVRFEEVLEREQGIGGKRGDGPYFNGDAFCLVDAAVAPALQRLAWCEEIAPDLEIFAPTPGVAAWRDALLQRPSVTASTVNDIREQFAVHLRGGGSPNRNVDPSWLGTKV